MGFSAKYDFPEWRGLHPETRISLLLILEGVKRGALIELYAPMKKEKRKYLSEQKNLLKHCIEHFGLSFGNYELTYFISLDPDFLEMLKNGKIELGVFLGYPQCCIDNFESINSLVQKYGPEIIWTKGPAVVFGKKIKEEFEKGILNDLMFYCFHVPCDTKCAASIIMAQKIKKVLISCDLEAADYLKEYNEMYIHS